MDKNALKLLVISVLVSYWSIPPRQGSLFLWLLSRHLIWSLSLISRFLSNLSLRLQISHFFSFRDYQDLFISSRSNLDYWGSLSQKRWKALPRRCRALAPPLLSSSPAVSISSLSPSISTPPHYYGSTYLSLFVSLYQYESDFVCFVCRVDSRMRGWRRRWYIRLYLCISVSLFWIWFCFVFFCNKCRRSLKVEEEA